jgi:hypothetical protein
MACSRDVTLACSYCWGRNIENQCGSNASTYVSAAEPLRVPGVNDAKIVKCGKFSSCASSGTGSQHRLWCWGNKLAANSGFASIQPNITWPSPTIIPLPNDKPLKEGADTFSIGLYTGDVEPPFVLSSFNTLLMLEGCALVAEFPTSSYLWCWGDIRFLRPEQFIGSVPFHASMMEIPGTLGKDLIAGLRSLLPTFPWYFFRFLYFLYVYITSVAVGVNHACAIDDFVGGVYCWGTNVFCQLGYQASSCLLSTSNPRQENPVRAQEQLPQKFAAVTVSNTYTCAITIGKALYCWGDNRFGFLGNLSAALAVVPTPVLVNLNAVPHPAFPLIVQLFVSILLLTALPPDYSLHYRFLQLLSRVGPSRVRWLTRCLRSCTVGDTVSMFDFVMLAFSQFRITFPFITNQVYMALLVLAYQSKHVFVNLHSLLKWLLLAA